MAEAGERESLVHVLVPLSHLQGANDWNVLIVGFFAERDVFHHVEERRTRQKSLKGLIGTQNNASHLKNDRSPYRIHVAVVAGVGQSTRFDGHGWRT